MKMLNHILRLTLCLTVVLRAAADPTPPALVPAPQKMVLGQGEFTLKADTIICTDRASIATGRQLAERLRKSTGYSVKVSSRLSASRAIKNAILLTTKEAKADLGAEGYELTVASNSVVIRAPSQAGLFYGAQTLSQLLPPEIFSTNVVAHKDWQMPCVQIEDQPRFTWRGMMLDVSRDFFTKEEVEQILDLLALHKINTFHWHLVDNNGWRIEIKKYPKLTTVGAWREHSRVTPRRPRADNPEKGTAHPAWAEALPTVYGPDGRYGGFYTQKEIREVVAYAAARSTTVKHKVSRRI